MFRMKDVIPTMIIYFTKDGQEDYKNYNEGDWSKWGLKI